MKNIRKSFSETMDILVKAYLNDTLRHGDCCACAVGNIIADSLDCKIVSNPNNPRVLMWDKYPGYYPGNPKSKIEELSHLRKGWAAVFSMDIPSKDQEINEDEYKGFAKIQIDSTKYTWQELAKIEKSF